MQITRHLAGSAISFFLLLLSPYSYAANSNADNNNDKITPPKYSDANQTSTANKATGNIYACVYMPSKQPGTLHFVFKPTYMTGIGKDTSTLKQTTLDVSQPGVSCAPMGNISSSTDLIAVQTYLVSYSVSGQPYSGSAMITGILMGRISSGTCTGSDGLVRIDNGGNTEVCYSDARCSGSTQQCIKFKQDMYMIFYPLTTGHQPKVTSEKPKIQTKIQGSIQITVDGKTKTHTFEKTSSN